MNIRTAAFIAAAVMLAVQPAHADGDAERGLKLFSKCVACHSAKDQANKTGPHLRGVVGRAVASVEGFKYSPAMTEYAKVAGAWDDAKLDAYVASPKSVVAKTKMVFPGLKKPEEREDIIAYLKTLAP
jgi:cytochrome c